MTEDGGKATPPVCRYSTFLFNVEKTGRGMFVTFWNVFVVKIRKVECKVKEIFSAGFCEFSKCDNVSLYPKEIRNHEAVAYRE